MGWLQPAPPSRTSSPPALTVTVTSAGWTPGFRIPPRQNRWTSASGSYPRRSKSWCSRQWLPGPPIPSSCPSPARHPVSPPNRFHDFDSQELEHPRLSGDGQLFPWETGIVSTTPRSGLGGRRPGADPTPSVGPAAATGPGRFTPPGHHSAHGATRLARSRPVPHGPGRRAAYPSRRRAAGGGQLVHGDGAAQHPTGAGHRGALPGRDRGASGAARRHVR